MSAKTLTIDGDSLTLDDVARVARDPATQVRLADSARDRVAAASRAVEDFVARGQVVYGITTGFGAFKDRLIPPADVTALQRNIVMSHATGVGDPLPTDAVRAAMLVRANTLARGHSGIRVATLETLLAMLNRGVVPVVPCQGSLGSSGDLAPLAHIALTLIGQGEAWYQGKRLPGDEALRRAGIAPVELAAKEGLALTNGTAVMTAIGALAAVDAGGLCRAADIAGALSMEALHATPRALDPRIHQARPHPRQLECAAFMRQLLAGSTFLRPDDPRNVQDPYTLRCIPQVHGAIRDVVLYARWALEIELNSTTDNPLIFLSDDGAPAEVISGGNFHGEPVALAMDYLTLGLTELGNMSERRVARLVDATSNGGVLPAFLVKHGGLNSGFMLAHYTATALASENRGLAHPASADNIPACANTEDHNSMGTIAARHAAQALRHVQTIVAIEALAAAQGIDLRREGLGPDAQLGRGTAAAYALIRQHVPFLAQDCVMYPLIETARRLVAEGTLVTAVADKGGIS
ncbi:MAG: histidine ammonia-lyase [Chloroflexi bacterium]|nr:histidine ammonia-lyase [Chloroflexota bacterium]